MRLVYLLLALLFVLPLSVYGQNPRRACTDTSCLQNSGAHLCADVALGGSCEALITNLGDIRAGRCIEVGGVAGAGSCICREAATDRLFGDKDCDGPTKETGEEYLDNPSVEGGTGDVTGPVGSTADGVVLFSGTSGKTIKELSGGTTGDVVTRQSSGGASWAAPASGQSNTFYVSRHADLAAAVSAASGSTGAMIVVDTDTTITSGQMPLTLPANSRLVGLSRPLGSVDSVAVITCDFPAAGTGSPVNQDCIRIGGNDVILENLVITADADVSNEGAANFSRRDALIVANSVNRLVLDKVSLYGSATRLGNGLFLAGCGRCVARTSLVRNFNIGIYVTESDSGSVATSSFRLINSQVSVNVFGVVVERRTVTRAGGAISSPGVAADQGLLVDASEMLDNGTAILVLPNADDTTNPLDVTVRSSSLSPQAAGQPVTCAPGSFTASGGSSPIFDACCLKAVTVTALTNGFYDKIGTGVGGGQNIAAEATASGHPFVDGDHVTFPATVTGMTEIAGATVAVDAVTAGAFDIDAETYQMGTWTGSHVAQMSYCDANIYAAHSGTILSSQNTYNANSSTGINILRRGFSVTKRDLSQDDTFISSKRERFDDASLSMFEVINSSKPVNNDLTDHWSLRRWNKYGGIFDHLLEVNPTVALEGSLPDLADVARLEELLKDSAEEATMTAKRWSPVDDGHQAFRGYEPYTHARALSECTPLTHGQPQLLSDTLVGDHGSQCRPGGSTEKICHCEVSLSAGADPPVEGTSSAGSATTLDVAGIVWAEDAFNGAAGEHWVVIRENTATEEWRRILDTVADVSGDSRIVFRALDTAAGTGTAFRIVQSRRRMVRRSPPSSQTAWRIRETGNAATITGITKGDPTIITVSSHPFRHDVGGYYGQAVHFHDVAGMVEINGLVGKIVDAADTSFTVDIDSTNFTAWSSGGVAHAHVYDQDLDTPAAPDVRHAAIFDGASPDSEHPVIKITSTLPDHCVQIEHVDDAAVYGNNWWGTNGGVSNSAIRLISGHVNKIYGFAGWAGQNTNSLVIDPADAVAADSLQGITNGFGVFLHNQQFHFVAVRGGTERFTSKPALNMTGSVNQLGLGDGKAHDFHGHTSRLEAHFIHYWKSVGSAEWASTYLYSIMKHFGVGANRGDHHNSFAVLDDYPSLPSTHTLQQDINTGRLTPVAAYCNRFPVFTDVTNVQIDTPVNGKTRVTIANAIPPGYDISSVAFSGVGGTFGDLVNNQLVQIDTVNSTRIDLWLESSGTSWSDNGTAETVQEVLPMGWNIQSMKQLIFHTKTNTF